MKKKPTVGSPLVGTFLSDRLLKATGDVNAHSLFTVKIPADHTGKFCKLYQ